MLIPIVRRFSIILALSWLSTSLLSQSPYYPDSDWQSKSPSELNINSALLDSAVAFAIRNETDTDYDLRIALLKSFGSIEPDFRILGPTKDRGKPAGIIVKDGYIVAQWGDVDRVDMTFSVTKSYLATVAGLAVDAGHIDSVDDHVYKYIWDGKFDSPHNAKITWRHLLDQSSNWSGCLHEICDWADRPPREGTIDDWRSRPLLGPGTIYEYNDVRVNLLAHCLMHVWRRPLPAILKEKIMDPIGASTTWRWYGYENSFENVDGLMVQSVSGGGHFGGGLFINTLDHARFGLLFLRQGKWKGEQLISEAWIDAMREPSKPNPSYGFLWWLNGEGDLAGVSTDVYYAAGFGGNYIVVDEEHDLVIVTRWLDGATLGEFVRQVVDSVGS